MLSYPNDDTALALQVEILLVTDDCVPAQLQHLQTYSSPHLSGQLLKILKYANKDSYFLFLQIIRRISQKLSRKARVFAMFLVENYILD
jgi:hypothetical protein